MRSVLIKVSESHMGNRLFDMGNAQLNRDNCIQPYAMLRSSLQSLGINLQTADMADPAQSEKIIFFDLSKENLKYLNYCLKQGWRDKLMLVLWEGPAVIKRNWNLKLHKYFDKILTWNDDFVDNKKYFKIFYPQPELPNYSYKVPFEQKKFCTLIAANKSSGKPNELYSERRRAISFFENKIGDDFALYGHNWGKPATKLEKWFPILSPKYCSYKGPIKEKGAVYSNYKFAICYENVTNIKGYITEKIFDCFRGGCIPVYWGATNITDFVPENTFIHKINYPSYSDLLDFLLSINEKEYNGYIDRINQYLLSDKFKLFSNENFITIMSTHIV